MSERVGKSEFFVRTILGALFVWAGIMKAVAPQDFADAIASFHLLPSWLINSMALALPVFEIALGFSLVLGWRVRLMAQVTTALLLIFTVGLLQAQLRGLKVDCHCFGSAVALAEIIPPLPRDLLLLAAAGFLYYRARTREVRTKIAASIPAAPDP